jgi:hypothetical protein
LPEGILSLGGGRPDPLPLEPVFVGKGRAPPGRLGGVGADMTSMSRNDPSKLFWWVNDQVYGRLRYQSRGRMTRFGLIGPGCPRDVRNVGSGV